MTHIHVFHVVRNFSFERYVLTVLPDGVHISIRSIFHILWDLNV